ncbi:sigma factor [Effusibacillus dendaii]|uniref:Uncharacterized protein n=1 Tax=Effusibacillus dendaii TaxID=2743772 RepID=A0A7I8D906_9BACL|nr:sigma factor [Effusibacillus dendaii]BCJ86565.1 hypothetical protein skT53_15500 [Effusibacillus dendaii]
MNRTDKETQLESWMEEYGTTVLRTAYFFVKDRHLAEDIYQDVFSPTVTV